MEQVVALIILRGFSWKIPNEIYRQDTGKKKHCFVFIEGPGKGVCLEVDSWSVRIINLCKVSV